MLLVGHDLESVDEIPFLLTGMAIMKLGGF